MSGNEDYQRSPEHPRERLPSGTGGSDRPTAATSEMDPPAKRRRGRPRSLVFNYFIREQEPDGGTMVNRCVFCGFRSRDKSQNPTYLARHILLACCAPEDVVERIRLARSSPPQGDFRYSAAASQAVAAPIAGGSVGAAPCTILPPARYASSLPVPAIDQNASIPAADNAERSSSCGLPFNGSRTLPSPTTQADLRARQNYQQVMPPESRSVRERDGECLLPPPHPPRLSSTPGKSLHQGAIPDHYRAHDQRGTRSEDGRPGFLPILRGISDMHSATTAHFPTQSVPPPVVTSSSASHLAPSPYVGTSLKPRPELPPGSNQFRSIQEHMHVNVSQGGGRRSLDPGQMSSPRQSMPSFSSFKLHADSKGGLQTPTHFEALDARKRMLQGMPVMQNSEPADVEKQRVLTRCRELVRNALDDTSGSTLICVGPDSGTSYFDGTHGRLTPTKASICWHGYEAEGTDLNMGPVDSYMEGMKSEAYNGICSVMVLSVDRGLVYLGSEDCMLASQLATFVVAFAKQVRDGSVFALLFTCSPQNTVVAELQSNHKNVFWVVDVAHSTDELCKRIVSSSSAVSRCVQWTKEVSRFLSLVLPECPEFQAVTSLPNAIRFSSVFSAMMQLYTQRGRIVDALRQFQRAVVQIDELRIANGISRALKSKELVEEIFHTAQLFNSLGDLVALYDTSVYEPHEQQCGYERFSARGIVHVRTDCENALNTLENLNMPASFVPLHQSVFQIARSFLVGDDKTPDVGVGMIVGNAALLASYLDPGRPNCAQGALKVWHKQRLYRAVQIACGTPNSAEVTAAWGQLLRFIFEKETLFPREAMSPSALALSSRNWWRSYGRTAAPDLCNLALKVLAVPASVGAVVRRVAAMTARDESLRGATLRIDGSKRDHLFCAWNATLCRMRDDELAHLGSPLALSFREMSEMLS